MKQRITVAHVVATMRDGGAEALLRGLIPRLALEPDLDVHVVSVYDSRLTAAERGALLAPVHEINRRGRRDLGFASRLVGTLRDIKPHIVHGHIHTGKYAGRIAAIVAGVPSLVFTEHGDEAGGLLRTAIKRVLNARTARFIVFTEQERLRYAREERIAARKIAVIPNGIPLPEPVDRQALRAALGVRSGEIAIVSTARLVPQKNQQLALRALALLRERGRHDLGLFIIGDGPDRAALGALSAELGLDGCVRFCGYRTDAADLMSAADIFALPSVWEKMPLVLGEAMLRGAPVVSTPWEGVAPFIDSGQTGWLASGNDPAAFADALDAALADSGTRQAVAERAAAFARERFDLARTTAAHAELYRGLAQSSPTVADQAGRGESTHTE